MDNLNLITTDAKDLLRSYKSYYLNKKHPLLGFNQSQKILKGFKKKDYTTGILYLQPSDLVSVKTLCAFAEPAGCREECLGRTAGRLRMNNAQRAMTRRTIQYVLDKDDFKERLRKEILKRETDNYCIRLNGTSDENWTDLISTLPNVQFYDYTKILKYVERNTLSNYHLTYSGSFKSQSMIDKIKLAVERGYNTSLSLNTNEIKGEWKRPDTLVVNGVLHELDNHDDTDLRFLDKKGSLGTLLRKGSNIKKRLLDATQECFFGNPSTLALLA